MRKLYTVNWSPKAKIQLRNVIEYWNKRNGSTAYSRKLMRLIKKDLEMIRVFPRSRVAVAFGNKNIRMSVVNNFKLVYKIDEDTIKILAFYDSRQDVDMLKI